VTTMAQLVIIHICAMLICSAAKYFTKLKIKVAG
jgi:hypothetical protein